MPHGETSRLIFSINQLNGFYMTEALALDYLKVSKEHCVNSGRIRSYYGPYFPAF